MQVTSKPIKKIVIVGGGTAGWLAAATLGNIFKQCSVGVELVESGEVGIIGVGEATIPPLLDTIRSLGIDEVDFIKATQASFKWGIKFEDWHTKGQSYFHPFGSIGATIDGHDFFQCWLKSQAEGDTTPLMTHSPESQPSKSNKFFLPFEAMNTPLKNAKYALHLDAVLVGDYLKKFCLNIGVTHTIAHVKRALIDESGNISHIELKDNRRIAGDFFIDCSGFKGLLIEQALDVGYDNWSHYLPCNRAVAVQTEKVGETLPYTISKAQKAGWTWRIPLQHRTGNGYVFCDKYISDKEAIETLLANVEGKVLTEPRVIPFTTGLRRKTWYKNCLALGLAQGFLEPLESTAIHLVSKTLALFVRMFPDQQSNLVLQHEFNRRVRQDYEEIRDLLVLHYCTTNRNDSPFWRWCKNMEIPATLNHKLIFYRSSGCLIPGVEELFQPTSWYAVLTGMQVMPHRYNSSIDALDYNQLQSSMRLGRQSIWQCVTKQPSHDDFLQRYCPAPKPA
ncbi:MAG: tryptophan 7-halogenase [Opitutaceae bacterium]|nr:tryptophan 7-halogenase [Opitutaceae bacterium]